MSLAPYTSAIETAEITSGEDFESPFLVTIDGVLGGVIQKRLYLRNKDTAKSYSSITVSVSNEADPALIDDSKGISWKLFAGDQQPTDEQWKLTSPVNTINLPDIGTVSVSDTSTYLPFWVRVEIPRSTDIQTIKDIKILTIANEILV